AALAELEPSQPAPDAAVTDYLLGQADPITKADVQRRIADDPATADTVGAYADQLRLLAPGSSTPSVAPVAATSAFPSLGASQPSPASSPPAPSEPRQPRAPLTGAQRRLIAILLGAALLAAILILILTGVIGGSDDDEQPQGSPAATTATLNAVPGQTGEGTAQFGFSGANLAANLQISGLKPSGENDSYTLWLYGSTGAFPLHQTTVDRTGAIGGQITLNEAVICLIAADVFPEMRLSRVSNSQMNSILRQARRANNGNGKIPDYVGKTVLEGKISMPQDAKDQIVPNCSGAAASTSTE
ncbi:MAG: hypothetical protein M3Y45_00295, partial [Actinomycetota bacterium]|nr:hypothetical protein [Actinomycetota bacterium]